MIAAVTTVSGPCNWAPESGPCGSTGSRLWRSDGKRPCGREFWQSPGDLNEPFPFGDEHFEIVHANQVIEHLKDTDNFIKEIWRTLKPGGYAVICTENLGSWHNIFSLVFGWQPFSLTNVSGKRFQIGNPLAIHYEVAPSNPQSWQHNRVFAYRGLKEIFAVHGFVIEHIEGSGYYPLPNCLSKLDPRHAAFLTLKIRKAGSTGSQTV